MIFEFKSRSLAKNEPIPRKISSLLGHCKLLFSTTIFQLYHCMGSQRKPVNYDRNEKKGDRPRRETKARHAVAAMFLIAVCERLTTIITF